MRIVNAAGRLGLITPAGVIDVEKASDGHFSADPQAVYERWPQFRQWADRQAAAPTVGAVLTVDADKVEAPAPRPRQVFAIGLNYRDHAEEAGMDVSATSMVVFTKFPSSITGPRSTIELPPGSVDWETELVVVIGEAAHRVDADAAWGHVAGLTLGQDISERELQLRPPTPQFNLGKSFPGFAPMGPELVTPDEFADRDDIEIGCRLNGRPMQQGRTSNMIFPVPAIIATLSRTVRLLPGDVIFTGTPAGIGWARTPRILLQPGDELVSTASTIGAMHHRFVVAAG